MTELTRILVTPRWSGTIEDDWYPWLEGELGGDLVTRVALPDRQAPTIEGCVRAFGAALDAGDPATTLCVGHSVSVQGWLHTFASRPERRVAGLIGVAGWWTVDESWPTIVPWLEADHDFEALRRSCDRYVVLISDNDPFTADHEHNARTWRERLDADVRILPGAKHLNHDTAPAVLAAVREFLDD